MTKPVSSLFAIAAVLAAAAPTALAETYNGAACVTNQTTTSITTRAGLQNTGSSEITMLCPIVRKPGTTSGVGQLGKVWVVDLNLGQSVICSAAARHPEGGILFTAEIATEADGTSEEAQPLTLVGPYFPSDSVARFFKCRIPGVFVSGGEARRSAVVTYESTEL